MAKKIEGVFDLVEVIELGFGHNSFGLLWKGEAGSEGQFPEYFKRGAGDAEAPTAIAPSDAKQTGLAAKIFEGAKILTDLAGSPIGFDPPDTERSYQSYVAPKSGAWASPGPTGEAQTVTLGDGTTVTYAWYKFIDQPALQNLNLTPEQKKQLQYRIELLHQKYRDIKGKYMKPPSTGSLVSMDPKLIVEPPSGLEVGYVPIVTRQAPVFIPPPRPRSPG